MTDHDLVLQQAYAVSYQWFDKVSLAPLGNGHIHHTFLLTRVSDNSRFVLQRVSESVFVDPLLVHEQTLRITEHLARDEDFCSRYRVPRLQPNKHGELYCAAESGFWRIWQYLGNSKVFQNLQNQNQIVLSAGAFADYQKALASLPGEHLQESIVGFLKMDHYLQQFDLVANSAAKVLMSSIDQLRDQGSDFAESNAHIHADCKVNNLLFNPQGSAVTSIIDLDTTMYGHWALDFGDLTRSIAFSRGAVDVQDFACAAEGYLAGLGRPVTERVVQNMVDAPGHIAGMLGLRFLTDHLMGDVYFRTQHEGENLQRAVQQFALMQQFRQQHKQMEEVVKRLGAGIT
jgi:thiamine kinase-like enzyme